MMKSCMYWLSLCLFLTGCNENTGSKTAPVTEKTKKLVAKNRVKQAKVRTPKAEEKTPDEDLDNPEDAKTLLVGVWRLDVNSVQPDASMKALSKFEREEAIRLRRANMRNVAYEFGAKGKLAIFLGGQHIQRGSYSIEKSNKNVLTMSAKTVGPMGSKSDTWQVKVRSKSLVVTNLDDRETFRLVRGQPLVGIGN